MTLWRLHPGAWTNKSLRSFWVPSVLRHVNKIVATKISYCVLDEWKPQACEEGKGQGHWFVFIQKKTLICSWNWNRTHREMYALHVIVCQEIQIPLGRVLTTSIMMYRWHSCNKSGELVAGGRGGDGEKGGRGRSQMQDSVFVIFCTIYYLSVLKR